MFHTQNAYEDAHGRILVDLCQYNKGFDVSTLWAAHGPVTLDQWTIDPAAGMVTQQRLDDRGQEFPRVDDRIISRLYRYGYSAVIGEVTQAITAAGDFTDDAFTNAILKHDLDHGTVQVHEFGRDATAGEAVFAPAWRRTPPRTTATSWPSSTIPTAARPTWLSPRRPGLHRRAGRAHPPAGRIPRGFHGNWIPDR